MAHGCDGFIATCIDFRFQEFIENWAHENFGSKNYDRVTWAGGVQDLDGVLNQLVISDKLHHIKKAVLVNHEDCGAYGEAGTAEKHAEDLKNAATRVKDQFPHLEVETYFLHLDGTFEPNAYQTNSSDNDSILLKVDNITCPKP